MKIMHLLLCLFFLAAASPALAQEAPPVQTITPRYQTIVTRDLTAYSLDTSTVRYVQDPYRDELLLEAWIKSSDSDAVTARYQRYLFRQKERQLQLMASGEYDSQTAAPIELSLQRYHVSRWQDIAPESIQELLYAAVINYAETNKESLLKKWKAK